MDILTVTGRVYIITGVISRYTEHAHVVLHMRTRISPWQQHLFRKSSTACSPLMVFYEWISRLQQERSRVTVSIHTPALVKGVEWKDRTE